MFQSCQYFSLNYICIPIYRTDISEFWFIHVSGNHHRSQFVYTIYRKFRCFDTLFFWLLQAILRNNVHICDQSYAYIRAMQQCFGQKHCKTEGSTRNWAHDLPKWGSSQDHWENMASVTPIWCRSRQDVASMIVHQSWCKALWDSLWFQAILNCCSAVVNLAKHHRCPFLYLLSFTLFYVLIFYKNPYFPCFFLIL